MKSATGAKSKSAEYSQRWREKHPERAKEVSQRYCAKNRAALNAKTRSWQASNPEKVAAISRRHAPRRSARGREARSKHTPEYFAARLEEQNGACAICARVIAGSKAHADHDHASGLPRGVLCTGCNVGLGRVESAKLQRML